MVRDYAEFINPPTMCGNCMVQLDYDTKITHDGTWVQLIGRCPKCLEQEVLHETEVNPFGDSDSYQVDGEL